MKFRFDFRFFANFLTFVILALFLSPVSMVFAANRAGEIVLIKGDVFILDAKANIVADPQGRRGRQTKVGAEFFEGETVSTKVGARVKLRFDEGGNEIVLGSDTTLLIERAGAGGAKKGTTLNLSKGEVRSDVKIKYSGQGADVYEVKSKNAVAGVRGTIFVAMLDKAQNFTVATERGAVFVQSVRTGGAAATGYRVNAGQFVTSSPEGVAPPKPVSSNPELKATIESLGGGKSDKSESKEGSEGSSAGSSSENRSGDGEKSDSESSSSNESGEKSDKQDKADKSEQKDKSDKNESADSKESSAEKSDKKEVSDSKDSSSSSSEKKETADKKDSGDRREKSDRQTVSESNEKKSSDSSTASNDSSSSKKETAASGGSKESSRTSADTSRSTASTDTKKTNSAPPASVQDVAVSTAPPLGQEKVTPATTSSFGSGKTDFKSGSGGMTMNNPASGTSGGRAPASTAPAADANKPALMLPGGSDGGVNRPAVGSTGGVYMGPPPTTGVPSFVSEPAKSALDNAAAAQKTYTNDKATSSQTGTVKVIIR